MRREGLSRGSWRLLPVSGAGPCLRAPGDPTADIRGAPSALGPAGALPKVSGGRGGCGLPAGRASGGRPGLSAAAAGPSPTRESPLTSARPRTCPSAAHACARSGEGTRPLPWARSGSARGTRRGRPGDASAPPAATDWPAAWRGGGTGSESHASHAAAAPLPAPAPLPKGPAH